MKHLHAFSCPVFALENNLAAGNSILHWSPCARPGVNLGLSSLHARNVSLVLNLHTGCVSPQYHCRFDNFFEMVKHGGPDVSVLTACQQLSGLTVMSQTPSMEYQDKALSPSEHMQFGNNAIPPTQKTDNTISCGDTADTPIFFDQHMQDFSNDPVATVSEGRTALHQPLQDSAVLPDLSIGAGTSSRGRVCKMSRAMAESVLEWDFYGRDKMHYMASQAMCEHDYECLHDSHLDLQDCMCHPIVFLAEMMGDIIYMHQKLRQPDAKDFMEAVIEEFNGHIDNNNWKLIPRTEVPGDTQVVPSVWTMQHKQDLITGRVTKHKARLNLHCGK
jgi:hypothetical protein